MQLTSERLDVGADERIRGVVMVPSLIAMIAAGGPSHVAHELADIGFRDVQMFERVPMLWRNGRDVPTPDELAVLLWFEGTSVRAASYRRELAEDLRLVRAWDPREDDIGAEPMTPTTPEASPPAIAHPYATAPEPARAVVGTRVVVFAEAYPLERRLA